MRPIHTTKPTRLIRMENLVDQVTHQNNIKWFLSFDLVLHHSRLWMNRWYIFHVNDAIYCHHIHLCNIWSFLAYGQYTKNKSWQIFHSNDTTQLNELWLTILIVLSTKEMRLFVIIWAFAPVLWILRISPEHLFSGTAKNVPFVSIQVPFVKCIVCKAFALKAKCSFDINKGISLVSIFVRNCERKQKQSYKIQFVTQLIK